MYHLGWPARARALESVPQTHKTPTSGPESSYEQVPGSHNTDRTETPQYLYLPITNHNTYRT